MTARSLTTLRVCTVFLAALFSATVRAQQTAPLRLEKTISLAGVSGRIDHLAFDASHNRLFVAALGNDTVEVIDAAAGQRIHSISGLAEPQGVLYEASRNRLWIANGRDGTVRLFDATTFAPLRSIALGDDADNIRQFTPAGSAPRVVVGYGSGGLAIFSPDADKLADIHLPAHPESFQIEPSGSRIFVNVPDAHQVAVVDPVAAKVIASWHTGDASANFPMALDSADGRLFIVCRRPAVLLVLDTHTGAVVARLPTVGDSDDLFFDPVSHRLLISGGQGAIALYQQQSADRYSPIADLQTVPGARTSLFVPSLHRLFLAVRAQGSTTASIRVYDTGH